jgi:membrane protease YdiL (CAAX protease family)
METKQTSRTGWAQQLILFLIFVTIGSIIMVMFNPWRPTLNIQADYIVRLSLIGILYLASQIARKSARFKQYWLVIFGFFTLVTAVSLDYIFGLHLITEVGVTDTTTRGWALQKFNEFIVIVPTVLFLNKVAGLKLEDIYIQKGNLKLGLIIGGITFTLAAAGSIPMANLFYGQNLTIARIIPWIPAVLVFVFANAAMEEILFRGLFFKKLAPFFGPFASNLIVAIVFTLIHQGAIYTSDEYIFLAVLFPLALLWGYFMQKTEGVWASILFHAGMDIPIILGIFSNL